MHTGAEHTFLVGLYWPPNNRYEQRKACEVSLTGLFILDNPCPKTGEKIDIAIKTVIQRSPLELSTYVVSSGADGFALRYAGLSGQDRQTLKKIISPSWDGNNLLEGQLIYSAYEHVTDLAGWLRLTSVIDSQHQSLCKNRFPVR